MEQHERDLEATQTAVEVTSTAYADDAAIDVEERLRTELTVRDVEVDDEQWLASAARSIRAGHPVELMDRHAPGSLGGDNGGG